MGTARVPHRALRRYVGAGAGSRCGQRRLRRRGAPFATPTKPDAGPLLDIAGVGAVARAVPVPVVAVGGVEPAHAAALFAAGVAGVALVRGVVRASDPAAVVRLILAAAASLPPAPTNEAGA
jgi:thiamine-phosphate pyrophosphorylase